MAQFKQIVTYDLLVIVITPLYILLAALMFYEEGVFWGLIGIAIAIITVGIPTYWTYRHRTGEFKKTLDFLERLFLFQIDEKIAILDRYISDIPSWKAKGQDYINSNSEMIVSDFTAMYRMKSDINPDQRIKINEKKIRLVQLMKNNGLDTAKIEAVAELLK
jgi:hypothetical protein